MTTNITKIDMEALYYALQQYMNLGKSNIMLIVNAGTWYGMVASKSDDVDESCHTYWGFPVFIDQNKPFGTVTFEEKNI